MVDVYKRQDQVIKNDNLLLLDEQPLTLAGQQIGIAAKKRCGLVETIGMRLPICRDAAVPILSLIHI